MNILALDPATHCGWAHSCGISGVWDLSIRRDESSGMRLLRLESKLYEILRAGDVSLVAFERAAHAAPKMQGALVVQGEIQGQIKATCDRHKVEWRGYSPSEIKKFATGKGNAKKPEMIEAACKLASRQITDDNEADAVCLLYLAKRDYQHLVFNGIEKEQNYAEQ